MSDVVDALTKVGIPPILIALAVFVMLLGAASPLTKGLPVIGKVAGGFVRWARRRARTTPEMQAVQLDAQRDDIRFLKDRLAEMSDLREYLIYDSRWHAQVELSGDHEHLPVHLDFESFIETRRDSE
jgi:Sec-independent protein translocase protein TatA